MAKESSHLPTLDDDPELLVSSLSYNLPQEKSFSEKEIGRCMEVGYRVYLRVSIKIFDAPLC